METVEFQHTLTSHHPELPPVYSTPDMALKDDAIHLRVPPNNLLIEVTKASVTQVTTTEEEVKTK